MEEDEEEEEEDEEVENIICEICHQDDPDTDDQLLICEKDCGRGFHTFCLKPPLKDIPKGAWFCPVCTKSKGIR